MGDNDKKGGQPKEPELPKDAPQDIKDFVSCKANSVELKPGKVTWLPKFLGEFTPDPDISFEQGADGNSIKINVSLGASTSITAKVDGNGQLSVDTSDSILNEFSDGITGWINDLNGWMKSKGKKLGKPALKDGKLTLTKENATTAMAPAPAGGGGVKEGSFFPNVPMAEKLGAVLVTLAAITGAIVALPSDKTSVKTATEVVSVPGSPVSGEPSSVQPPPVVASGPTIGDACIGLFHVPGVYSLIQLYFTSELRFAGPWDARFTQTPDGTESGNGFLAPNGHGEIDIRITQFGTRTDLIIWGPNNVNVPIGAFASELPLTVTSQPKECNPRTMTVPTGASSGGSPTTPVTSAKPGTGSGRSETRTIETQVRSTDHGGAPYSLLLIPGTLMFVGGSLYLDEKRRRRCLEDDDDDYPVRGGQFKIDPRLLGERHRYQPSLVTTSAADPDDTGEHPVVPPATEPSGGDKIAPPELPPSSPDDYKPKPPDWRPPDVM